MVTVFTIAEEPSRVCEVLIETDVDEARGPARDGCEGPGHLVVGDVVDGNLEVEAVGAVRVLPPPASSSSTLGAMMVAADKAMSM